MIAAGLSTDIQGSSADAGAERSMNESSDASATMALAWDAIVSLWGFHERVVW